MANKLIPEDQEIQERDRDLRDKEDNLLKTLNRLRRNTKTEGEIEYSGTRENKALSETNSTTKLQYIWEQRKETLITTKDKNTPDLNNKLHLCHLALIN